MGTDPPNMTTLADEFLADLEELDDDSDAEDAPTLDEDGMEVEEPDDADLVLDSLKQNTVASVAKLLETERAKSLLAEIDRLLTDTTAPYGGNVNQDNKEYELILECNSVVSDIVQEVDDVHKFIRDRYTVKFPELDSLVPNALDYARVVKQIGNEEEM